MGPPDIGKDLRQPMAELVDEWFCNEKRLIETAGLDGVQALFAQVPVEPSEMVQRVDAIAGQLGVPKDEVMPWNR